MKCNNCGKKNKSNAEFCVYCGSKIDTAYKERAINNPKSVKCTNCGKKNKMPVSFCLYCGSPISVDEDKTENQNKHRLLPVIAIISIVLSLAIITGVLLGTGVIPIGSGNRKIGRIDYKDFTEEDIIFENNRMYVDNQLLITADEQYNYNEVKKIVARYGGEIVGCIEFTNDYQIEFEGSSFRKLSEIRNNLQSELEKTEIVFHNVYKITIEENNKSSQNGNWWRNAIELDSLNSENYNYQTVKVGVFDCGFDTLNDSIKEKIKKVYSNNFNQDEPEYHGTAVSGLITAVDGNDYQYNGTSDNSDLYVYSYQMSTLYTGEMKYKYALALMLYDGCKVINFSNGYNEMIVGATHGDKDALEDFYSFRDSMTKFLKKFIDKDYSFIIVKAAGNVNGKAWFKTNSNAYEESYYSLSLDDPDLSNYDNVLPETTYGTQYDIFGGIEDISVRKRIIMVGASDEKNKPTSFSVRGEGVDIYAPGTNLGVLDYDNGKYGLKMGDGTSYSAPIVSGVVARMWGINPDISADDIKDIIINSSLTNIEGEMYPVKSNNDNSVQLFYSKHLVDAHRAINWAKEHKGMETRIKAGNSGMVMGIVRKIKYENETINNVGECKIKIYKEYDALTENRSQELLKEFTTGESGEFDLELEAGDYIITAESLDGKYSSKQVGFSVMANQITYVDYLFIYNNADTDIEDKLVNNNWDLKLVYYDERDTYINPKYYNIGDPYWSAVKDVDTHLVFNGDGSFETSFGVKSIKGTYRVINEDIFLKYDVYAINSTDPVETDVEGKIDIIIKKFPQFSDEKQTLEFYAFDHINYYFDENESFDSSFGGGYEVDTNKLYSSDLIQKVGDDVYYCSSDGAPEYLALPTLDFSEAKPEYKKLPIDVEYGVQSFIIYGDSIFYICDYPNGHYNDSAGTYGKLYKCDLQGNNQELIADYVDNLLFDIHDYTLTYSARQSGQKTTIYSYDIKNHQIANKTQSGTIGVLELGYIFRFEKSQGHMELDDGYYYYEIVRSNGTEPNRIDGKLANIIFYREDKKTGKVDRVGYTYDQARG